MPSRGFGRNPPPQPRLPIGLAAEPRQTRSATLNQDGDSPSGNHSEARTGRMPDHLHVPPHGFYVTGGAPIRVSTALPSRSRKVVSWNLLRRTGAAVADIAALIEQEE